MTAGHGHVVHHVLEGQVGIGEIVFQIPAGLVHRRVVYYLPEFAETHVH